MQSSTGKMKPPYNPSPFQKFQRLVSKYTVNVAINLTFHLRAKVKDNKDPNHSMHIDSRTENESPLCVHSFAFLLAE